METREELIKYLEARGIEFNENISDEKLKELVGDRLIKEAQSS